MLDLIFWSVVALVLWFAWDTYKHNKAQREVQNKNNAGMETINEFKGQGPLGL